jgi:Peptidase family S41
VALLTTIADEIKQWLHHNLTFPSAVVAINEEPVETYLDKWMRTGWHQDLDALYNALFWSAAQNTFNRPEAYINGAFAGSGFAQFFYAGPSTVIQYANGVNTTYQNFAKVNVDLAGVEDGESFYQKFCAGEERQSSASASATTITRPANPSSTASQAPSASTALPGNPQPVVLHPHNFIAGYYLNGPGYDQIAVLAIYNFVLGSTNADQIAIQHTAQDFFRLAKAAGKTKLILDVRGNPGGTILQAFGLFKQLFPHLHPWGATRFRAFDTFNVVGQQISSLANAYHNGSNTTTMNYNATGVEPFDTAVALNSHNQIFPSWSALYGPFSIPQRDNFTNLIRYNLSLPDIPSWLGINMTAPRRTPFASEDIILLQDGFCASTCATFSDLLTIQAGIKSIVLGGRPQYEPMQAVGGTRGVEIYSFPEIYDLINFAWKSGTPQQQEEWNRTVPDLGAVSMEPMRRMAKPGWGSANVRDSILPAQVADGIPSQFLWRPADCRLWYTPEMVLDVMAVWRKVGDVAWGGEMGWCVVGGW